MPLLFTHGLSRFTRDVAQLVSAENIECGLENFHLKSVTIKI